MSPIQSQPRHNNQTISADDDVTDVSQPLPGYRLQRLEVYNWGTFDSTHQSTRGRVYSIQPDGQNALLIGQNGSGKSTLVDSLLTLLVRPAVRNYNVAAGAKKRERDERTYIKGAFDRRSRSDESGADVQYLRPENTHYSVLLACFSNAQNGKAFTIAQILYVNAEGRAEKVYCFAPEEKSIATDCSGLRTMERLTAQMKKRGFQATRTYNEYHEWFRRATGARPRAMDMLNQTVAVKDIQKLNDFIRDHMLEARPWSEKVDDLLSHFTQLSEAHRSLVKVRRQFELLEPIARHGQTFREKSRLLDDARCKLDAADSFFRQQVVDLFSPVILQKQQQQVTAVDEQKALDEKIAHVRDECRRLQNEMEQASGARLREIPLLIKTAERTASGKRDRNQQLHEWLQSGGIKGQCSDANKFAVMQSQIPVLMEKIRQRISTEEKKRVALHVQRADIERQLEDTNTDFTALTQRRGNLPENLAEIRDALCESLNVPQTELPFAAELMAVLPDESDWQSSIEMVLRSFSLSLLVPDQHYHAVSRYLNETRILDRRGRGQKLVYLRISKAALRSTKTSGKTKRAGATPHPHSLARKLEYHPEHDLAQWVRSQVEDRFDFRCCDSMDEFQQVSGRALTRERHTKSGQIRHEKDDRDHATDPRYFVLGWDNDFKSQHLVAVATRHQEQLAELDEQIEQFDLALKMLRERRSCLKQAAQVRYFADIDATIHEKEVKALKREMRQLEKENTAVVTLRSSLEEREQLANELQTQRDVLLREQGEIEKSIRDCETLVSNAQEILSQRAADDSLELHERSFPALHAEFESTELTVDNLFDQERIYRAAKQAELDKHRATVEPVQTRLLKMMNRFLRESPVERSDLDASVEYLDGYLKLLEQIRSEDLPRHEQRFKERLNDKVTREVGLLNGELQKERSEIEDRIEVLNEALAQLDYRPGTFMRLEARLVRDREITEFRNDLANCLDGCFAGTLTADEDRFLQIEKLIKRLRDDDRWRNKVTDVRRWFDFAAQEIEEATGEERGYYEDSAGQSGGEKAKLAFTILVAAIAYQYDITPGRPTSDRLHFVVVDEMFSKVDDQYSEYALELFRKFGLQLLIVAPLDAKARVTEPYVGCYALVAKGKDSRSQIHTMTAHEFEETTSTGPVTQKAPARSTANRAQRNSETA